MTKYTIYLNICSRRKVTGCKIFKLNFNKIKTGFVVQAKFAKKLVTALIYVLINTTRLFISLQIVGFLIFVNIFYHNWIINYSYGTNSKTAFETGFFF